MKKISKNRLENIHGGNCFLSSWIAAAGVATMNVALIHVGATTFYACVRYL
ncbi:hypothetical protein N6B72_12935 [Chryseobacterium soli]|uniref:hypothetical protein n=1 Tax=Chryseobacterium soli TaxID=445961 RepID=UPI0029557599|nr:hypothetical protein [Chryseobacterium soli]MDV7697829.1 hypothetical protein [Chryseobacterium soli]